jgi:hypothetical protein
MKPLVEVWKESLDRTLRVWPLYAWQAGIEVMRLVTMAPVILFALAPIWKHKADFAGGDFSRFSDTLVKILWQSGWWKMALGMFALYVVWWLIIEALVNGGVFGRLWAWVGKKEPFALGTYVREGFRFFPPLIGLHLLTMAVSLVVVGVPLGLIVLAGVGDPASAGGGTVVLLVLGFLLLIPAVLILAVVAVWWLVARGYITSGHGLTGSLRLSLDRCMRDKGRVFWGLNLLFLLIFAVLMGVNLVFSILQLIPVLGLVFSLVSFLVSMLTTAFLAVYVPSVVVTYVDEK